ncbi:MAG: hypothetical protein ACPL7O_11310 [Armatimonadota bacterium]
MIHVEIFSVRGRLPARIMAAKGTSESSCLERNYRLLLIFRYTLVIHDEELSICTKPLAFKTATDINI